MASTFDSNAPPWRARLLLRAARSASLATTLDGQPFATLVTPAWTSDLSALLLLSDLSEHTRHLRADPRCALLVAGQAESANPQTAPRVTVTGLAEVVDEAGSRERYLTVHPYAALYADFGDFNLWRVKPLAGLYVGGFARAARLRAQDLRPDPDAIATLAAAEASVIAHCNRDHPDAMARVAGDPARAWRLVGVDADGCDLASDEEIRRVAWSAPVASADDVRRELVRLARRG